MENKQRECGLKNEPVAICDRFADAVEKSIITLRRKRVIIDRDLAKIFDIETKYLNQLVKRNIARFTEKAKFQLTDNETKKLISKYERFESLKHSSANPTAFTELGIVLFAATFKGNNNTDPGTRIIELIMGIPEQADTQKKRIAELNHRNWTEMTLLGTQTFCHTMLKLSAMYKNRVSDDVIENYLKKVIRYNHNKTIEAHLDELEKECPFPEDIRGFLHEHSGKRKFQPKHLMCKVALMRDEANKITYEFLIEYGLLETDVEIYYGIKAISDHTDTTEEFVKQTQEVMKAFRKVLLGKSERGEDANESRKARRNKYTNNASDGSFWIVWQRVESDMTLLKAIGMLQKLYKKFNKCYDYQVCKNSFDDISNVLYVNSSPNAWDEFHAWIVSINDWLKCTKENDKKLKAETIDGNKKWEIIQDKLDRACKSTATTLPILRRIDKDDSNRRYIFMVSNSEALWFLKQVINGPYYQMDHYKKRKSWKIITDKELTNKVFEKKRLKRPILSAIFSTETTSYLDEDFWNAESKDFNCSQD